MERVKAIVFLLVGAGLFGLALVTATGVRRFVAHSEVARGRVSRLNAGGSHPQITFTTLRGETISFPQGGLIAGYKPSDEVRVRYRAADPRLSACIESFGALWSAPIMLGFLGFGLGLAGLLNFPFATRS